MYKSKYFKIQELVPPDLYKKYGDLCWLLFDVRLLITADSLREFFNEPLLINDCVNFTQSGLRTDDSVGAELSLHKYGKALDLKFIGKHDIAFYNEKRKRIMDNYKLFPYLRGLENNVNWLHIDTGNRQGEGIVLFNP